MKNKKQSKDKSKISGKTDTSSKKKFGKSYGRFILSSRLQWLKSGNETVFHVYKKDGTWHATVHSAEMAKNFEAKGYIIRPGDLQKEITETEMTIRSLSEDKKTEPEGRITGSGNPVKPDNQL